MRKDSQHETTNRADADARIDDLQPRPVDQADTVKGGYEDYAGILGRSSQRPSRRRPGYRSW